jgi:putative membrane protein
MGSTRYQLVLLAVLVALLLASLVRPIYPHDQLLHHGLTLVAIAALLLSRRLCPLTNASATAIVAFLALHVVGARWVYSNVPYDDWSETLFGFAITDRFGLARNHYDRAVHFGFGLLVTIPAYEILLRWVKPSRIVAAPLALVIILASSLVYELAEWFIAITLAGETADRYLGQQGDIWDAHKDMSLAGLGGLVTATLLVAGGWAPRLRDPSPR